MHFQQTERERERRSRRWKLPRWNSRIRRKHKNCKLNYQLGKFSLAEKGSALRIRASANWWRVPHVCVRVAFTCAYVCASLWNVLLQSVAVCLSFCPRVCLPLLVPRAEPCDECASERKLQFACVRAKHLFVCEIDSLPHVRVCVCVPRCVQGYACL